MAKDKQIKIALAGNPNCGKTTIFNNITGAKQHVVKRKKGNTIIMVKNYYSLIYLERTV